MSDENYPDPDAFADPLEDYSPKAFDDPLEQALAEESVERIRHEPMATIAPEATVRDAVQQLTRLKVACLLVEENRKLVGIFSDRDVLMRVALEADAVFDRPVREVMTTDPVYVYETDSSAAAFSVMAAVGFRHVPVLDLEQNLVGIVSPQRVTSFLISHLPSQP